MTAAALPRSARFDRDRAPLDRPSEKPFALEIAPAIAPANKAVQVVEHLNVHDQQGELPGFAIRDNLANQTLAASLRDDAESVAAIIGTEGEL